MSNKNNHIHGKTELICSPLPITVGTYFWYFIKYVNLSHSTESLQKTNN